MSEFTSVFRPAGMVRPFLKLGIDGYQGSGKSFTAAAILAGIYKDFKVDAPFYFMDNEKSSKWLLPFLRQQGITNVEVVETDSLDVFVRGIREVSKAGGCLLIDSLTKFSYRMERDYLAGLKSTRDTIQVQDRPILTAKWLQMFEEPFVNANAHVGFTGRAAIDWGNAIEEDDRTGREKRTFFAKGVKMMGMKETLYAPDFVIYMERQEKLDVTTPTGQKGEKEVWREGTVIKDRSQVLDGRTFKWGPKDIGRVYSDLAPMFRFLLSAPAGEPNVASGDPAAVFPAQVDDSERQALLEEIKADLVAAHPDATQAGKKAKGELLMAGFGTRAWSNVERLSPDELRAGREKMRAARPVAPVKPERIVAPPEPPAPVVEAPVTPTAPAAPAGLPELDF